MFIKIRELILLPDGDDKEPHPLTFLISSPPGSGKITFAAELCYLNNGVI
jgi:hypothetical protein